MTSLAKSLKATVSTSLNQIPAAGYWSKGPVYRQIDSDFLERPLIPKAPPTPRLRIDRISGTPRVLDLVRTTAVSEMPPTVSLPELSFRVSSLPESNKPQLMFQIAALGAGFAAGLAAAFLFGWL
jgi:hypothetical protein